MTKYNKSNSSNSRYLKMSVDGRQFALDWHTIGTPVTSDGKDDPHPWVHLLRRLGDILNINERWVMQAPSIMPIPLMSKFACRAGVDIFQSSWKRLFNDHSPSSENNPRQFVTVYQKVCPNKRPKYIITTYTQQFSTLMVAVNISLLICTPKMRS